MVPGFTGLAGLVPSISEASALERTFPLVLSRE